MAAVKTRLSYGDLQRELGREFELGGRPMTRGILDRILRDWARELPEPEILMGCRTWKVEDLDAFRSAVQRDREGRAHV